MKAILLSFLLSATAFAYPADGDRGEYGDYDPPLPLWYYAVLAGVIGTGWYFIKRR